VGGGLAERAAGEEGGGEERERDRLHRRRMLAAWHPEGNPARRTINMPQSAWSSKRERQYEHIKHGLRERGTGEDKAEEIAARTVNKERARSGEARTSSRTSTEDISSSRRGGLRSHEGSGGRTYAQLYNEARDRGIEGRSSMSKAQLLRALAARAG